MPYQRHGPAAGLFTSKDQRETRVFVSHVGNYTSSIWNVQNQLLHFRHIFHLEIWYYYTLHSLVFQREIFLLHGSLVKFLPSLASGVENARFPMSFGNCQLVQSQLANICKKNRFSQADTERWKSVNGNHPSFSLPSNLVLERYLAERLSRVDMT